jgi:hypothetical protein
MTDTVPVLFGGFFEVFLAYAAKRAHPVCRKVFECSPWSYAIVRISGCRIVYISADFTNILFHGNM